MEGKKVLISVTSITFAVGVFLSLKWGGEGIARAQNNFNLDTISKCVVSELPDNNITSGNLTNAFDKCALNMRSIGITGDVFVIKKSNKKLFWDASVDCKPESGEKLFMTEDGVCSLFSKPETCVESVNSMILNPPDGSITWQFDDNQEYVNYIYLEKYNKKGIKIPIIVDNSEYIISQGTQQDEIRKFFYMTEFLIITGVIVITLIINY